MLHGQDYTRLKNLVLTHFALSFYYRFANGTETSQYAGDDLSEKSYMGMKRQFLKKKKS